MCICLYRVACIIILVLVATLPQRTIAQQQEAEETSATENVMEGYLQHTDQLPEDDMHQQQLQTYSRHKIDLNTADATVLRSLGILSPLQLKHLLLYRRQMGQLISIYELQAVPGFDEQVIKALLPYIKTGHDLEPRYHLSDYLKRGEHNLLLRYGRDLSAGKAYAHTDSTPAKYAGGPDKLFMRYRYNFPRYMSWGAVIEKDAGEALFARKQPMGFDFYSAHLFIRQYKYIKAFALGDFTVNMGQGLLNWQSLAFGKGSAVMQVKREGELLRPYASAGEFKFYRGAGVTVAAGKWRGTAFISSRKLDGSITSQSGYHRTQSEVMKKHSLSQFSLGGNVTVEGNNWKAGLNYIHHHLSAPVKKGSRPYQRFNFEGTRLNAVSADYEATWRNCHLFGEIAMSGNGSVAYISGLLASVSAQADLVLLYRNYNRAYQSFYSDAWGEFYKPVNENGIYTGISLKLTSRLKLEAYADHFRFPWLQYRLDAPGRGRDLLAVLTFMPDKQTELSLRYNNIVKQENGEEENDLISPPVNVIRQSWRIQSKMQYGGGLSFRNRIEANRYIKEGRNQQAFLFFQEVLYEYNRLPLQFYARFTRFVAEGGESRLYTITSGMLYEYALSKLSGEGHQYQLRIRWKCRSNITIWVRYQLTVLESFGSKGGSGNSIAGPWDSAVQCQLQYLF